MEGLLHPNRGQRGQVAVAVAHELGGVDGEIALAALLVGRRHPVDHGPRRPRVGVGTVVGRTGHDLELTDRGSPLAVGGSEAVGAGVAPADDHHPLARRRDGRFVEVALLDPVGRRQVLHGLAHAPQLPARNGQVPPGGGPAGQHHRIEVVLQFLGGDVGADIHTRPELGSLGLHLGQAAVEMALLHLELGDAVAQQTADAVGPLEHHHPMTGAGQLLGRGQAGRTRPHHGHAVAGAGRGGLGHDPALGPGPVDDLDLDLLDGHRELVNAQHAGGLARRGAQPAGELGEVVGGVQSLDGPVPMAAVHQVVPVGDQVAEGAAAVAERDAAVHAARRLLAELLRREVLVHLAPVAQPHRHRAPGRQLPAVHQEPPRVSHGQPSPPSRTPSAECQPGEPSPSYRMPSPGCQPWAAAITAAVSSPPSARACSAASITRL